MNLSFVVEGQDEGTYMAVIASYANGDVFYLDAVYRKTDIDKKARLNIALPGW